MVPKRYFLLFLAALAFGSSFPSQARADGWLEFFFPSLKETKPDQSVTGRAEWDHGDGVVTTPTIEEGLPENSTPVHMRHRPSADIAKWVETVLPDVMSFEVDTYKDDYKKKVVFFDKTAKNEYLRFLRDSNYLKTLETGRYDINAFVEEIPMILNEGEVEGRYRWLYQARVMVTYVSKGATNYKLVKEEDTITQNMFVTVQVGRLEPKDFPTFPEGMEDMNPHGIIIESFNVKVVKPKKS